MSGTERAPRPTCAGAAREPALPARSRASGKRSACARAPQARLRQRSGRSGRTSAGERTRTSTGLAARRDLNPPRLPVPPHPRPAQDRAARPRGSSAFRQQGTLESRLMPGMRPEDVYELTGVSDPRISPDGSRIAYVVWSLDRESNEYRGAIWVAPFDGAGEPRRFTSGEKRDGSPRWSPDGRWLAFTSNRGAEKTPPQLYVMPADGGEARCLTEGKEGVDSVAWSPDSSRIAFVRRVRDEAYEEEDDAKRAPRRFRRLFYKLDGVGWTGDRHAAPLRGRPRGRRGAPAHRRRLRGRRARLDAGRNADRLQRAARRALGHGARHAPLRGRRGRRRAAAAHRRRRLLREPVLLPRRHAHRLPLRAGGRHVPAPRADRRDERRRHGRPAADDLARPAVPAVPARRASRSGTAERIVFTIEDGGNIHLYAVAADGSSEPELLVGGERSLGLYDAVAGRLAYTSSTATEPMELHTGVEAAEADERVGGLRRRPRARRAGALHGGLGGRHRGRRVARPPRRLRGGQALPRAADDPRRPVRAVRHRLLRRGPGVRGRRLRGALREPARRLRPLGGVGAARSAARSTGRGRAGAPSTTPT